VELPGPGGRAALAPSASPDGAASAAAAHMVPPARHICRSTINSSSMMLGTCAAAAAAGAAGHRWGACRNANVIVDTRPSPPWDTLRAPAVLRHALANTDSTLYCATCTTSALLVVVTRGFGRVPGILAGLPAAARASPAARAFRKDKHAACTMVAKLAIAAACLACLCALGASLEPPAPCPTVCKTRPAKEQQVRPGCTHARRNQRTGVTRAPGNFGTSQDASHLAHGRHPPPAQCTTGHATRACALLLQACRNLAVNEQMKKLAPKGAGWWPSMTAGLGRCARLPFLPHCQS
jgi:hypothetical protein